MERGGESMIRRRKEGREGRRGGERVEVEEEERNT